MLLLFAFSAAAMAAPIDISGSLSAGLAVGLEESYYLNPGSELELNLDHQLGDSAFHVGIRGNYNDGFKIELDEAYLDYYAEQFEIRLGKQRLSWGTALQINPTDVINPVNIEDPLGDKQALYAAAVDYYLGYNTKLSAVWVPIFKPALEKIPHPLVPGQVITPEKVEPKLENSELGVRASFMGVNGWDFSASYFRGWEDFPTVKFGPTGPQASFRKTQMFGLDVATTVGDMGFWAEGAYFLPKDADSYYQLVVGGDYGFQNGLVLIGQYYHRSGDGSVNNVILAAEYPFGLMHSAKLGAMYSLDSNEYMISPEVAFSLADSTSLVAGVQYFSSSPNDLGMPAMGQNRSMYAKLKIGF
jgi:hypothetical protein